MEEKALAKSLVRIRTGAAPAEGPVVSIVVTNRDGEHHLERLLRALSDRTRYSSYEVVLVDNGSRDRSRALFEAWDGRKQLIANSENRSFSAANNQGIRAAQGELVLLANNDIEPIHPDWLGYMVESLTEDVAGVGALLVYPRRPAKDTPPAYPDLTIQHSGTSFEYSRWGVRAVNTGAGADPMSITSPARRRVPAVTAACLLARRADLLSEPLDEQYWYGSEDWDLSLRLGARGDIVLDERAVLFHHEFGTQDKYMSSEWLEGRTRNHQWFNALWGPSLMRAIRTEVTGPRSDWFFRGDEPPTAVITAGSDAKGQAIAEKLREQATRRGWTVIDSEGRACDIAIALAPPRAVPWFGGVDLSIAVVLDREQEWARSGALDASTAVAAADMVGQSRIDAVWGDRIATPIPEVPNGEPDAFDRLLQLGRPGPNVMRIGVSTCAPDWERAQFWGDTHMARGLMRAFRRLGHEATELIQEDWQGARAASCDVVVHLRGLTRRPVSRGQWNLLWIISHPDRLEPDECDDYDIVASASLQHAELLTERLGRQVHYLPQATDADTFRPGPTDPDFETGVLYVGNARWPSRRAPRWMMRNHRPFALYGKNWDKFPEAPLVVSEYISNRDLPVAYRSASIVVADHHGSMRSNGFVANRLFDVLASGGVPLTDDVAGLREVFGDLIPTYSNPAELESRIRILLADPAGRRAIARQGRQLVMSAHTLDQRARTLLGWLDQL